MKPNYIKAKGIAYRNEIAAISKSKNPLQPLYEAFTNAWEAIVERFTTKHLNHGKICISFHYTRGLMQDQEDVPCQFLKIEVEDNGIGFTKTNYVRFESLRDDSKSCSNKGTGRVQYLHTFDDTTIDSTYKDRGKYKHIVVSMSKKQSYLAQNAIARILQHEDSEAVSSGTKVTFENVLDKKLDEKYYLEITPMDLKTQLLIHYLSKFCENRERLPQIVIKRIEDDTETFACKIETKDIPTPHKEDTIEVPYSKIGERNRVVTTNKKEKFTLLSFVQGESQLDSNCIYYVSNGALAQEVPIDAIPKKDTIDSKRFLFLLRGKYFDSVDDDLRGDLHLVKEADFKRQNESSLFPEECLLEDNIRSYTNSKINSLYPQLLEKKEDALKNLDEIKDMFLIDEDSIASLRKSIKSADSDETILRCIYKTDMEVMARGDAELKEQYNALLKLSPELPDYQERLQERVNDFVKFVPLQNRTSITKYIARRKLVLKIFEMILDKELDSLKSGGRIDEDLLHNLIFQQHSTNPETSDLWLLDDQYLYFKGCSEKDFNHLEINGERIIKDDTELSPEELDYKTRTGKKDIGLRRPDVLLFPEEGKCIIIEFKAPDVDVERHLSQINRYAMMLRNLSIEKYNILSFYGYLIGGEIDYRDIQENDTSFKNANHLNYVFRPYYEVTGLFGRQSGALYTEIITYSDILERSKLRNKIFLDKLAAIEK